MSATVPAFVTRDPVLTEVLRAAERVARTQAAVLITGESGTGKTRLARLLHAWSPRASGPLVEVACANLPAELVESELFGHEEGAFTDAHVARLGRFEIAHGGTLLLDDIQELRPEAQAKVLRVVEDKRFERLGGRATVEVDVRVIAATRENPERFVARGVLREDLFYRLNVVRLTLPPLRERIGDLPRLATVLLEEIAADHRAPVRTLGRDALARLRAHGWPGNVRELRHVLESAAILAASETIGVGDLPATLSVTRPAAMLASASEERTLAEVEADYIDEVLRKTRGNKSAAARILGIHRKTLHEKLRARRREPAS